MTLWLARMMLRTILCLAVVIAASSGPLAAQERIAQFQKKLEKGWDDIKPRGKLLQQVRDSFKSDDSKSAKGKLGGSAAARESAQSPTLAPPRSTQARPAPTGSNRSAAGGLGWPRTAQRDEKTRTAAPKSTAKSRNERAERANAGSERNARNERTRREQPDSAANAGERPAGAAGSSPVELGVVLDKKQKSAEGLRIAKVSADSPADRAGLRAGDVLVTIAGVPTSELQTLDELMTAFGPNDQIQVEYLRGKKPGQAMLSFGDAALPVDEPIGDEPAPAFDDASVAPLPPGLPPPPSEITTDEESPGLISVLAEPRRTAPLPGTPAPRPAAQANPYFPSPQVLPPVTGSAVGGGGGASIRQQPGARKLDAGSANRQMFQPLPPRSTSPAAPTKLPPQPANQPASDADIPEIEMLSPDGN